MSTNHDPAPVFPLSAIQGQPALVQALLHELQPGTRLAICHGLTLEHARCVSQSVTDWRSATTAPASAALPAVFAIGR